MRRALALLTALVLLVALATPAFAHDGETDTGHESLTMETAGDDGAEPLEFAALMVAGFALVGAVCALIMGTKRAPQ